MERTNKYDNPEASALQLFQLFQGLPSDHLDRYRRDMRVRVARAGQEIVGQESDDGKEVYFLISGEARVSLISPDGALVRLAEFQPGEVFGDLSAIDDVPRSAAVEVVQTCRYAVMSQDAFIRMITGSPEMALRMLRIVASRIRLQNERYFEKSALDLSGRVAREMLRRLTVDARGDVISPAPSPTELGRMIGARRESVSREISRLVRSGVFEKTESALVLTDRRALMDLVEHGRDESPDGD